MCLLLLGDREQQRFRLAVECLGHDDASPINHYHSVSGLVARDVDLVTRSAFLNERHMLSPWTISYIVQKGDLHTLHMQVPMYLLSELSAHVWILTITSVFIECLVCLARDVATKYDG